MQNLTPKKIVERLDRFIVGQSAAKRAVAVAVRNRWRRRQLEPELARNVNPKNIVMIGPTGVGKTEIARRLADLTAAPFVKVEASRFTEVGYHGRDVESMVRDLVEHSVSLVRAEQAELVKTKAKEAATDRLVDLLLPAPAPRGGYVPTHVSEEGREHTRQRLREQLDAGALDEREVELQVEERQAGRMMFANMGLDQMDPDMAGMLERMMPSQSKRRKMSVSAAREELTEQETQKLLDSDKIAELAIDRAQEQGIIFLDEIDKVAVGGGEDGRRGGPDISRQGVQRDLLPIVEGASVNTRHGVVRTDHVLFIAAGAFHSASVSDLMPELQGRFPIRVELEPLGLAQFVAILTDPDHALTRQQAALLAVEGIEVSFEDGAIEAMAELAVQANDRMENIGARRLMTIVEKVFEQINFDAPELAERGRTRLPITAEFVREQVAGIVEDEDLSRFVL